MVASACAWVATAGGCAIVDPFSAGEWRDQLVYLATAPIWFDLWIIRPENKPLTRLAIDFLALLRENILSMSGMQEQRALIKAQETTLSDWIFQRSGERRERPRSLRSHVPAVLQSNAEFSGDIDARFVRKAHASLQGRRVVVYEVRRLMSVQADAVTGSMRQPRKFVRRTPPF